MRAIRLKAAKHIHAQKKKAGALPADGVLSESACHMANIADGNLYYAGFTFRGALAPHFAMKGLISGLEGHHRYVSGGRELHKRGPGKQNPPRRAHGNAQARRRDAATQV